MMLDYSVNTALKSKLFDRILIVINKNQKKYVKNFSNKKIKIIFGGDSRQISSLKSLNYLKKNNPKNVFIHDAARPYLSIKLIKKILSNMKSNNAVVPFLNINDTTKIKKNNKTINFKRENVLLTQTPQCFKYNLIHKLSKENKKNITDECSLLLENNYKVKFIKGEHSNFKITNISDIKKKLIKNFYGIGFDIHKLVRNKKLYLGGIKIPFHSGLKGHSDGDVIIHCVIDSLLGALRKKDIGSLYPDNKKKFKNIRSVKLLKPIINELRINNCYINNLDINLICEKPKVSKYRDKIIRSLSKIMNINKNIINLKGKTVEKLGLIGKENAIACECIISINQYD